MRNFSISLAFEFRHLHFVPGHVIYEWESNSPLQAHPNHILHSITHQTSHRAVTGTATVPNWDLWELSVAELRPNLGLDFSFSFFFFSRVAGRRSALAVAVTLAAAVTSAGTAPGTAPGTIRRPNYYFLNLGFDWAWAWSEDNFLHISCTFLAHFSARHSTS